MSKEETKEREFPSFPYPPYEIQLGFMQSLYQALESGGVGLFESPTGTGKTLSLICGALTWLQDHREREAAAAQEKSKHQGNHGHSNDTNNDEADDMPDWLIDHASQKEEERRKLDEEARARRMAKAKARLLPPKNTIDTASTAAAAGGGVGGHDAVAKNDGEEESLDAEFLLDEWGEDGGGSGGGGKRRAAAAALLSDSSDSDEDELLAALRLAGEGQEPEPPKKTQIIFCSRTHSQLTQFVGELHRTQFADVVSLVALGSRRALCINDDVLRLKSPGLINERCLEMQKPSSSSSSRKLTATATADDNGAAALRPVGRKSTSTNKSKKTGGNKCIYLAAGTKSADTVRDMILAVPADIEELAKLGRRRGVCPYYASRRAGPEADVILAPYSALLVEETRMALGLRVEGSVLIVDEAHNLVDAINGSHSAELSASAASMAATQLGAYFDRFRSRLAPGNARNIQALRAAANALAKIASKPLPLPPASSASATTTTTREQQPQESRAVTVNDFLFQAGLDNINMFQLVRYARESKAIFKIAGFWQSQQQQRNQHSQASTSTFATSSTEGSTGCLHALVALLQALTNEDTDGRVIIDPTNSTVKFILLNAAAHFSKVAASARAVILASGTLSPLEPVLHLFPDVLPERMHRYQCGHVVGKERLLALALGIGPSGRVLDFRHESRSTTDTLDELASVLLNVCGAAPGGVVVFFPSFSYAEQVYARWEKTGMLAKLNGKKKVFCEPRTAGEVDAVLEQYAQCILPGSQDGDDDDGDVIKNISTSKPKNTKQGAMLLCVVGGKLAEGINFGDALGRLVVMVGLPYPNNKDPELQERLKFIEKQSGGSQAASREHYTNLCMKAVNQCIGRAIRHRNDYAAILLLDTRYAADVNSSISVNEGFTGPLTKLPEWMQQSLSVCSGFGDAFGRLVRFYKGMVASEVGR